MGIKYYFTVFSCLFSLAVFAQYGPSDDFDGDGIINNLDFDDDNDGVLDAIEMMCDTSTLSCDTVSYGNGSSPDSWGISSHCTGWYSTNANFDILGSVSGYLVSGWSIDLMGQPAGAGVNAGAYSETPGLVRHDFATMAGVSYSFTTNFPSAPPSLSTAAIYQVVDTETGTVLQTIDLKATPTTGIKTLNFTAIGSNVQIQIGYPEPTTGPYQVYNWIVKPANSLTTPSGDPVCTLIDIDTDLDGIPNRLDLDSDGDGCYDSYEAGVTDATYNGSSTDSITAGPYGGNGLGDALQSASDTNTTNYSLNYSLAISENLNFCADTDGDGIPDLTDIDDDNDGIIDAVESPDCFYASSYELIESISSPFTSTEDIGLLYNGVLEAAAAGYNVTTAVTAANNLPGTKMFTISYPYGVELNSITTSDNLSGTAGATADIYGSYDGSTWFKLTSTAQNIQTASGATFTLNQNPGAYQYYAIQTAAPVGGAAIATTDYIAEIKGNINHYSPSMYPQPTCDSDLDGDNTPNYLDLDSDGDGSMIAMKQA